jgi:hypothetical protein
MPVNGLKSSGFSGPSYNPHQRAGKFMSQKTTDYTRIPFLGLLISIRAMPQINCRFYNLLSGNTGIPIHLLSIYHYSNFIFAGHA